MGSARLPGLAMPLEHRFHLGIGSRFENIELVQAVVDVSGRPYLVHAGEPAGQEYHLIGGHFTGSLTRHVFEAITLHAGICLHMNVTAGRDPHHIVEAQFKAFARALRAAVEPDPRVEGIPSTKGAL